jgi:hypothetical protein
MPDLRDGFINWQKERLGGKDNEAIQRLVATFQSVIGKQDGALGRRQGRGADDVQPGKSAGTVGHFGGSHVRVAPGAGSGRARRSG